jgi:hypothetical protein
MSRTRGKIPTAPPPLPPPPPELDDLAVMITRTAVKVQEIASDLRAKAYACFAGRELPYEQVSQWEEWADLATHAESIAERHLEEVIQRWRTDVPADETIKPADFITRGVIVDRKLYLSLAPDPP